MQVMNMDFAARMRAAMKLTQEQKLMEATRVIQSALSGVNQPGPPADQAPRVRAIEGRVINLTAEVVEPDDMIVPGAAADIRSEMSQPSRIAAWARDIGELLKTRARGELPDFSLDALTDARPSKIVEIPDGGSVPEPVLCLRGRKPKLQALHSASHREEPTWAASDAAWRHPAWRRLRGWDPHE
jgi:hypothetical protein